MKRGLVVVALLMLLVMPACMAQELYSIESSPIATTSGFLVTQWQAYLGQKLQVTVKVTNNGGGTLHGFTVVVYASSPSAKVYTYDAKYTDDVPPGSSVTKVINTNIVLDELGQWNVGTELYSYDKSKKYDFDMKPIQVVEPPEPEPQPTIQITNLAGIAAVGAIGAIAGYGLSRLKF